MDTDQFNYKIDSSSRANYLFNTTIAGIEKADLCFNWWLPRRTTPVLNARIGKIQRLGSLKVARIGEIDDQTYKIEELGADLEVLKEIIDLKHNFVEQLKQAKCSIIIVGGAYSKKDGYAILSLIHELVKQHKIDFNILHKSCFNGR